MKTHRFMITVWACIIMIPMFLASTALGAVGEWKQQWDGTKKEYETLSGKKKPSDKFLGIFRTSAGIDKSLEAADTTFAAMSKNTTQKSYAAFEEKAEDFSKKKDVYIDKLEKAIDKAQGDVDKQTLTLLKQDLKSIEGSMRAQLAAFTKKLEGAGPGAQILSSMFEGLKGTIASAKKFAARINAQKDTAKKAELFSEGNNKIARDISQNIGNIIKTEKNGKTMETYGRTWNGSLPEDAYQDIQKWSNAQSGVKVDAAGVERELDDFMTAINAIDAWIKRQ